VTSFLQSCRVAGAALLLMLSAGGVFAAPVPAPLSAQDTALLQRFAAYLNGIRTMTAEFEQVANNGGVSNGKLWVQRPGKMRFEYEPPAQITLLADATSVYYWDRELKQVAKYDLKATPAWFLLRDPISFGDDVTVTAWQRVGTTVGVTLVENAQPDAGNLTLVFTENPLSLRQWIVVDQQGKQTTVTLSDRQFGMALDPKLFQYQYLFGGSPR